MITVLLSILESKLS